MKNGSFFAVKIVLIKHWVPGRTKGDAKNSHALRAKHFFCDSTLFSPCAPLNTFIRSARCKNQQASRVEIPASSGSKLRQSSRCESAFHLKMGAIRTMPPARYCRETKVSVRNAEEWKFRRELRARPSSPSQDEAFRPFAFIRSGARVRNAPTATFHLNDFWNCQSWGYRVFLRERKDKKNV